MKEEIGKEYKSFHFQLYKDEPLSETLYESSIKKTPIVSIGV